MTDKEKLSCLLDRPCDVCKFYNKDGCCKWTCVFDQKSELSEGEYIKKTDVLDKAVIETLSDYTEHDVVHVDEINKLPTFSVPEKENNIHDIRFIPVIADSRGYTDIFKCSKCGGIITTSSVTKELDYDFCPWCGGKAE